MDVDRFHAEGWTVVDRLFSPAECDAILDASGRRTHPQVNAELVSWATDPRWAPLALVALGPDVRLLREQPLSKLPESAATLPWQQDAGFAHLDPPAFLSCILALADANEQNGCLWVLPRSHLRGPVDHVPAGAIVRVADDVPAGDGVPVPLAKGAVLAFSSLTFHRSGPNRTTTRRESWLVQFCPSATVGPDGAPLDRSPIVAKGGVWQPSGA
jgi:ectoine hydroxylase-related dioxygenase (phytanoyl-CoA dioxygenase family)